MKRVIITPPSGASRLERIARWRSTHWQIFKFANLLIFLLIAFACSKASDDDNPNPEPQPQPQPELKGNYVMYEGKAKPVLTAEYRDAGNDNLRLYFYVSQDRKERVVCNLNAALHSDALIDLSKKEKKHDGQAYWGITYYNADSEQLLNAWGYPDDGFTLFDSGTLDIKGSLTLSPTLTLTKGSLKGTDGKDHTFAMHYQGPLTKVEDTKPDPTDTQAPHAGRLNSVQVVSQEKAIVRWNPASDNKTPEEKLRYVVCWKEKEGDKTYNSGEPKENILSYEITAKFEKNRIYIAWVEVYDQAGNKSKSNTEEFRCYNDVASPQVGTIEITDINMNSAVVKWTPATDNNTPQDKLSYTLFWFDSYTNETESREFSPGSVLSYKLTGLHSSPCRVWVKVRDEEGNESTYDTKEFKTLPDTEPPVATNVVVDARDKYAGGELLFNKGGIKVWWDRTPATDNVTPIRKITYKLYMQHRKSGYTTVYDVGTQTEWSSQEVRLLGGYDIWVEAFDEAGNKSVGKKRGMAYWLTEVKEEGSIFIIDGVKKKLYDFKKTVIKKGSLKDYRQYTFYLSADKKEYLDFLLYEAPSTGETRYIPLDREGYRWGMLYTFADGSWINAFGTPGPDTGGPFITGILELGMSIDHYFIVSDGRVKGKDGKVHTISFWTNKI